MARILVTGGFGYVGSRLVPHLLAQGHDVRVLDLMLYGDAGLEDLERDPQWPAWRSRFGLVRGDIRHAGPVAEALRDREVVIHLAAISNDPTGEIDEVLTRQVNYDAVGLLLVLAKEAGAHRFINASSSSVFGARSESEIGEDLEPEPLTCYSQYKALSEWLVRAADGPGFCTVNIRPATVCGVSPRQRFDLTVNKLTSDALTKGVITVHGGTQRRPNVGLTDMVNLYGQLVAEDPARLRGRTFNFGFENLQVIEIARLIRDELQDPRVEIRVTETRDLRDYHISSERIRRELGYRPVGSLRLEVQALRAAFAAGRFPRPDDPAHHNLQSMRIGRDSGCQALLRR